MKRSKVGILSLGCPRNLVDSETVLGRLKDKGCSIVDIKDADTAIINTCAFIEDAKKESIEAILDLIEMKKKGDIKKLIVSGCLSKRYKDVLIKEFPEVDAFVGNLSLNHSTDRFPITPGHYAYLKICEGCLNNCSFCVIPGIKGKFSSLRMESALKRVEEFDRGKISELNIIGQDISGYGMDLYGSSKLPELIKGILKRSRNIGWVRLLYLYPDIKVINALLDTIREEPRVCKYIDLPIQHINDRILKLMNRRTTKKGILEIIDRIRKKVPAAAIRTSLITGFPTETEKEFKELYEFVRNAALERLGVFIYSREEGTPAFGLKPQVPERISRQRFEAIMSLQQGISEKNNKKMLGQIIKVLVEEKTGTVTLGRSQYDAPEVDGVVYLRHAKRELKQGDFVQAKVIDTLEYDLVGEVIG